MGLIEVQKTDNSKEAKGTTYLVNTEFPSKPVRVTNQSITQTSSPHEPNTKHDHDDLKKHDHHHHQSARRHESSKTDDDDSNSSHFLATQKLYTSVTGNVWKKSDTSTYQKLKDIPLERIELAMRTVLQRATNPPGSLAYFAPEILGQPKMPPPLKPAPGGPGKYTPSEASKAWENLSEAEKQGWYKQMKEEMEGTGEYAWLIERYDEEYAQTSVWIQVHERFAENFGKNRCL